jgi:hypothetical protein
MSAPKLPVQITAISDTIGSFSNYSGLQGKIYGGVIQAVLAKQLIRQLQGAPGWSESEITTLNQPLSAQVGPNESPITIGASQIASENSDPKSDINKRISEGFKKAFGETTVTLSKATIKKLSDSAKIVVNSKNFPKELFIKIQRELVDSIIPGDKRTLKEILIFKGGDALVTEWVSQWQTLGFKSEADFAKALDTPMIFLASSVCHSQEIHFFVEQQVRVEDNAALNKLRTGSLDNATPNVLLSIPGINVAYSGRAPDEQTRGLVINMWESLLDSAVLQNCRHLAMPAIGLGAFAGKYGTVMAKIYYETLSQLLNSDKYKGKFDNIFVNTRGRERDFSSEFEAIFKPGEPIGGCKVQNFKKDVKFLAIELAKAGYRCALVNPSDADVVLGKYDVGEYFKNGNYVAEEDFSATSTAVVGSKGICDVYINPTRIFTTTPSAPGLTMQPASTKPVVPIMASPSLSSSSITAEDLEPETITGKDRAIFYQFLRKYLFPILTPNNIEYGQKDSFFLSFKIQVKEEDILRQYAKKINIHLDFTDKDSNFLNVNIKISDLNAVLNRMDNVRARSDGVQKPIREELLEQAKDTEQVKIKMEQYKNELNTVLETSLKWEPRTTGFSEKVAYGNLFQIASPPMTLDEAEKIQKKLQAAYPSLKDNEVFIKPPHSDMSSGAQVIYINIEALERAKKEASLALNNARFDFKKQASTTGWFNNCGLNCFSHFLIEKLVRGTDVERQVFTTSDPVVDTSLLTSFREYYNLKDLKPEFTLSHLQKMFSTTYTDPIMQEMIMAPVLRAHLAKKILLKDANTIKARASDAWEPPNVGKEGSIGQGVLGVKANFSDFIQFGLQGASLQEPIVRANYDELSKLHIKYKEEMGKYSEFPTDKELQEAYAKILREDKGYVARLQKSNINLPADYAKLTKDDKNKIKTLLLPQKYESLLFALRHKVPVPGILNFLKLPKTRSTDPDKYLTYDEYKKMNPPQGASALFKTFEQDLTGAGVKFIDDLVLDQVKKTRSDRVLEDCLGDAKKMWENSGYVKYANYMGALQNGAMYTNAELGDLAKGFGMGIAIYTQNQKDSAPVLDEPGSNPGWKIKMFNSGLHWEYEEDSVAKAEAHNGRYRGTPMAAIYPQSQDQESIALIMGEVSRAAESIGTPPLEAPNNYENDFQVKLQLHVKLKDLQTLDNTLEKNINYSLGDLSKKNFAQLSADVDKIMKLQDSEKTIATLLAEAQKINPRVLEESGFKEIISRHEVRKALLESDLDEIISHPVFKAEKDKNKDKSVASAVAISPSSISLPQLPLTQGQGLSSALDPTPAAPAQTIVAVTPIRGQMLYDAAHDASINILKQKIGSKDPLYEGVVPKENPLNSSSISINQKPKDLTITVDRKAKGEGVSTIHRSYDGKNAVAKVTVDNPIVDSIRIFAQTHKCFTPPPFNMNPCNNAEQALMVVEIFKKENVPFVLHTDDVALIKASTTDSAIKSRYEAIAKPDAVPKLTS